MGEDAHYAVSRVRSRKQLLGKKAQAKANENRQTVTVS
jgi:hypothetical protein